MRLIKFSRYRRYKEENFSDFGFQMLGMFLTGEVGDNDITYVEIILNPLKTGNAGNLICIDKAGEDVILSFDPIMDLTSEQTLDWILENDARDADRIFTIQKNQLVHLIKCWVKCYKVRFKEIWIKCEDGVFWIEGIDPMRQ